MNAVIIEDEHAAAKRFINLLCEIDPSIKVITILEGVEDAINWFLNNPSPDIIFMDIKLSDGLCFSIFEEVQISCPVIFTTAYDEYMLDAFRANGIDYLLKPIVKNELINSISKFRSFERHYSSLTPPQLNTILELNKSKIKTRFLVKTGNRIILIHIDDISYFFIFNQSVYIMTCKGKRYYIEYSLDTLETFMDTARFFRVNRKYLINLQSIESMQNCLGGKIKLTLLPCANEDVEVSRKRVPKFKEWLNV